jgi:hypothetical protein
MSEGIANCGTIRTAFRIYATKHDGVYPVLEACDASQLGILGIGAKDLEGMYYKVTDYSVNSDTDSYIITATHRASGETYIINQAGVESGTYKTGQ